MPADDWDFPHSDLWPLTEAEQRRVETALASRPEPKPEPVWLHPSYRTVVPYPTDLMECLCGTPVWVSQDGHRYAMDGLAHVCAPPVLESLHDLAADIADLQARRAEAEEASDLPVDVTDDGEKGTGTADPLRGL